MPTIIESIIHLQTIIHHSTTLLPSQIEELCTRIDDAYRDYTHGYTHQSVLDAEISSVEQYLINS